jgi:2-oxoglutarate ferredoxin oxidoreductase subunit alpha
MRELWKGNEAIAEAAIRAGLDAYFGYPITPQTELLEYMARRMPELGRVFVQAESEIAAINMVYGAACTGIRTMTSSSSPGISLMQEGLSYIAASEVPCVVVDMMRGGPGLGNIQPGQADYFQITRSAGHGDFHPLVLAPSTVQEAVNLTYASIELAMRYRTLVMIAADGALGQMMEPVSLPPMCSEVLPEQPWALTGAKGRKPREISSLQLAPEGLEEANLKLQAKLARIAAAEVRYESYLTDDAEILVVAFGTVARIARSAVRNARAMGIRAGLFRPITLWPFPEAALRALSRQVLSVLVVEMNAGQMAEDVRRCVSARAPVHFRGRMGGMIPMPDEIVGELAYLRRVHTMKHARNRALDTALES